MPTMSKEHREAYLAETHVGILAVERSDGCPLTVPIWYEYTGEGFIKFMTHERSLKARLIDAAGRFSLCAQDEDVPYKFVSVEGDVVDRRPVDIERDARPIARRYLGKHMGDQYIEDGDYDGSIVYFMRPTRWFSADYGEA